MLATTRHLIRRHRRKYPRGLAVVGHGEIRPGGTECPGPAVAGAIRAGAFTPPR